MMYKRLLCALMAALLVLGGICAAEDTLPLPEGAQTEEAPDDLAAAPVEAYPEELLSLDLDDAPGETEEAPAPADPEPSGETEGAPEGDPEEDPEEEPSGDPVEDPGEAPADEAPASTDAPPAPAEAAFAAGPAALSIGKGESVSLGAMLARRASPAR